MKNFLLVLAYFLKYGGFAGFLLFTFGLALTNSVGGDDQATIILYIVSFLVLFFIGNVWSKKLLRK